MAYTKKWVGQKPDKCDICQGTIGSVFYDAAMKQGPWALCCHRCFKQHCVGLGTGRGQKYDSKTLEKKDG